MDGAVFPQPLWGSEQEEPFGIQGVFGRKLQAADGQFAVAGNQPVFGVYETRKTKSKVRKGAAKELLGKCNQRC